jgi:hypothetical protein
MVSAWEITLKLIAAADDGALMFVGQPLLFPWAS